VRLELGSRGFQLLLQRSDFFILLGNLGSHLAGGDAVAVEFRAKLGSQALAVVRYLHGGSGSGSGVGAAIGVGGAESVSSVM
jgi:hypothetical protein